MYLSVLGCINMSSVCWFARAGVESLSWRELEWRGEPGGVTYKSRESQACNVLLHDVVGAICMVVVYCSSNIIQ